MNNKCIHCKSRNIKKIDTYKYFWYLCFDCGSASSQKKDSYLFSFLSPIINLFPKQRETFHNKMSLLIGNKAVKQNSSSMYDYFLQESHVEWTLNSVKEFKERVIQKYNIDINNKEILDISGGNGYFINEFKKDGANITFTEFNENAVKFVSENFGFTAYRFDVNEDSIENIIKNKKFDIVFLRAVIMFSKDINKLLESLKKVTHKDSLIIINYSVIPTVGTLLKTQYDEYNYFNLFSSKYLKEIVKEHKFEILGCDDDPDQEMYVYSQDRSRFLQLLKCFYEYKAISKIGMETKFSFRARNRRRFNLVLKNRD